MARTRRRSAASVVIPLPATLALTACPDREDKVVQHLRICPPTLRPVAGPRRAQAARMHVAPPQDFQLRRPNLAKRLRGPVVPGAGLR